MCKNKLMKTLSVFIVIISMCIPCRGFNSFSCLLTHNLSGRIKQTDILTKKYHVGLVAIGSWHSSIFYRFNRSSLCSTLFDDDNDLDWDDDDDEEDNNTMEISSNFENDPSFRNEKKEEGQSIEVVDLNELDDTDEAYYEQLFLQQSLDAEQSKETEISQWGKNNMRKEQTVENNDGAEVLRQSEEGYEMIIALRKEWKDKVSQMRNESIQTRKLSRKSIKRKNLEERATLLALRALRMQTIPLDESSFDKVILSPTPTLSISSSRNYKRKEDSMDEDEIKLEQKVYGKRFKTAKMVYIRLLEYFEEMRLESTAIASELIADRVKEQVSISVYISENTNNSAETSLVAEHKIKAIDEVTKMNESQQLRMSTVMHLSLNGQNLLKNQSEILDLKGVLTEDLCALVKIRGNVKRRGRLPKERSKVLKYLLESFSKPLF